MLRDGPGLGFVAAAGLHGVNAAAGPGGVVVEGVGHEPWTTFAAMSENSNGDCVHAAPGCCVGWVFNADAETTPVSIT